MKVFIGRNNTFSGNLTNRIGNLKSAKYLFFEKNNFSGKIPIGFSQLKNLGKCHIFVAGMNMTYIYIEVSS